jgi:catalase
MLISPCYYQTDQGIKNLMADKAADLSGSDPDYAQRDLFNAIAEGNFPSWTLYIQVMTFEEAERFRWNPFDLTKVHFLFLASFCWSMP